MIESIFGKKGKRGKSAQIINKVISGVDPDSIRKDLEKKEDIDLFEKFDECMDEKNGNTNN